MAIQGHEQKELVSFPSHTNWIQPGESDAGPYWDAVKARVQNLVVSDRACVLTARDAQGVLHVHLPHRGNQTARPQAPPPPPSGNDGIGAAGGDNTLSTAHALEPDLDKEQEDNDEGVGGEERTPSTVGSKRKQESRVLLSPKEMEILDVLPPALAVEKANVLVMKIGLRIQGSGLTHSKGGIAGEVVKIIHGMFDALVEQGWFLLKHKTQILAALPPAPSSSERNQGHAIWDKYGVLKRILLNETLPAFSTFFDMESFTMKQSGASFDDAKPM